MSRGARLLVVLATLVGLCAHAEDLPGDSVYRLRAALVDQDGRDTALDRNRGHPALVSMFYTSCPNVCPALLAAIERIDAALSPPERARLRGLLVGLDPARDTPQALKAAAARHHLDPGRWTLARAAEPDVRRLAAVLDVRYRRLPNGEYNHSSVVSLLDAGGRKVAETSMLAKLDEDFLARVRAELAKR